jgi:hypothetical protein
VDIHEQLVENTLMMLITLNNCQIGHVIRYVNYVAHGLADFPCTVNIKLYNNCFFILISVDK